MYRWLILPLLWLLPAETAHHFAFFWLRVTAALPGGKAILRALAGTRGSASRVEALGLSFPHPVGLAAGFDKDARGYEALAALGFGHIEVGTLTALAQPGNPKPRLFRLKADAALLNRMGFNNEGAHAAAVRLARPRNTIVGVNIGRSKLASNDDALADYEISTKALAPHADYFVVNVSSPNTPGLRDLQAVDKLRPLLTTVRDSLREHGAQRTADGARRKIPLLVKIAPDLANEDVDAVADLALELGLDGIIATNTTISRAGLQTPAQQVAALGAGGISGAPVRSRSLDVLLRIRRRIGPKLTLISVGGIDGPDEAWARIKAGASLVQIYTAFIYKGPWLAAQIARGVEKLALEEGYSRVQDAVGVAIDGNPNDSAHDPATSSGSDSDDDNSSGNGDGDDNDNDNDNDKNRSNGQSRDANGDVDTGRAGEGALQAATPQGGVGAPESAGPSSPLMRARPLARIGIPLMLSLLASLPGTPRAEATSSRHDLSVAAMPSPDRILGSWFGERGGAKDRDGDTIPDSFDPFPDDPDRPGVAPKATLFANTSSELYRIDPDSRAVERVGGFFFADGVGRSITDLAIDRFGVLYAVTFDELLVCHPSTARCEPLAFTGGGANALGILPASSQDQPDVMVYADTRGNWTAMTGTPFKDNVARGLLGAASSGDVVGWEGAVLATRKGNLPEDEVVSFPLATSTSIPEVLVRANLNTYGLAACAGEFWMFTDGGMIIHGAGPTESWSGEKTPQSWWGAACRIDGPPAEPSAEGDDDASRGADKTSDAGREKRDDTSGSGEREASPKPGLGCACG